MATIPTYGNYHGYYTKRPFLNDERLTCLPENIFMGARVLDVGCNEGWVTCEIARTYNASFVVGVDIDETLISAAWRRRRAVWSMQEPTNITKLEEPRKTSFHYFPASCEHEFGSLPIPPSSIRGKSSFPHNITFRTADWVNSSIPEDSEGYDVVIGFSISKWIHLNNGDEGIRRFFTKVNKVLHPGGTLVLEPQPWDSYAKAKRMSQKLKESGNLLRIRPSDFTSILNDVGFKLAQHFDTVGVGSFNRPIDVYVKK